MSAFESALSNLTHAESSGKLDENLLTAFLRGCSDLRPELEGLGLKLSLMQLERLEESLKANHGWRPLINENWSALTLRIRDELSTMVFFAFEQDADRLFSPALPLFGAEVDAKFPSLAYDIAEAGKCMALERSTAAAFHAIRSLEAGITAMSRCLGIPDPTRGADRNWGALLNKVKAELERRWPTAASRFSGDGKTFEELYASLAALQNPYRNATMHLDQVYTSEDAKHILDIVGGLLRKIASRMDEEGNPAVQ